MMANLTATLPSKKINFFPPCQYTPQNINKNVKNHTEASTVKVDFDEMSRSIAQF